MQQQIRTWTQIGSHTWQGPTTLEQSLVEALEGVNWRGTTLYTHVDVEALVNVLSPERSRGATHVSFEFEDRELRVSRDGTIAARPRERGRSEAVR